MEELFIKVCIAGQDKLRRVMERLNRQEGQTAVEYGLIVGFVALAVVAAFTLLGGRVRDAINAVADAINVKPQ
ncbi:MAG: Flp family type IVb pilin [Chloroflexi bacterium]|nr:Flp family type IVb pilin [Chloroflexota bacterium]